MKRILITGGTGTIGSAFIEHCGLDHIIGVFARSENRHGALHAKHPTVRHFYGAVENVTDVLRAVDGFRPDIIIHAAAMKHVEQCEADPLAANRANVMGSINVIDAARRFNVGLTIGVSTDKVHDNNIYGTTKRMMEQMFLAADTPDCRFCCVRLGNVAGSEGSVIAKWKAQAAAGDRLTITDPKMRRFWITPQAAAKAIQRALELESPDSYVLAPVMKQASVGEIAAEISSNFSVMGVRNGEQQDETLIARSELFRVSRVYGGDHDYWMINPNTSSNAYVQPVTTSNSEMMTYAEIVELVK